jgi:hypothetical protein
MPLRRSAAARGPRCHLFRFRWRRGLGRTLGFRRAYSTVRNLAVEDHGDGLIVSFEALRPDGSGVAQEIEVFGARALTDGDIIA